MEPSKERLLKRWASLKRPQIEQLQCYICNYTGKIELFKEFKCNDMFHAGQLIRYQCPDCDTIFGDLRFLTLPQSEIDNDYSDLYSFYKEGDTTPTILKMFELLNFPKEKYYLDYACGEWNNSVNELNKLGYTHIYCYDKYVGKYNNIDGKKFDVVYSNNYIEHLINPLNGIKEMLNYLKDDGLLVITSDCWDRYKIPETHYHTFWFPGRSIGVLCEKLHLSLELFIDMKVNINGVLYDVFLKAFKRKSFDTV